MGNCTIVDNSCLFQTSGGGIHSVNGPLLVSNSILWANKSGSGISESAQARIVSGGASFDFSNFEAWTGQLAGTGMISVPPVFSDPAGPDGVVGTGDDDFRLEHGSPCIDAGSNAFILPDLTDMDGDLDVNEPLPLDCCLQSRLIDDPEMVDQGEGQPVVDMGAAEFVPLCRGDATLDGVVDFSDLNIVRRRLVIRLTLTGTGRSTSRM